MRSLPADTAGTAKLPEIKASKPRFAPMRSRYTASADQTEKHRSNEDRQRRRLRHRDILCEGCNELVARLSRVLHVPKKMRCRGRAWSRRPSSKKVAGVTRIGHIRQP